MARVEQLDSAWFGVFYDVLLPLTITAHRFCQGTSNIGAPETECGAANTQQQSMGNVVSLETSLNQGGK